MSFVDLATLTMHRRSELEGRINTLDEKCDRAINDIKKLKTQARSFLSKMNCEPVELKERFLNSMKKLDEYMYLITDFNLAIGQLEEVSSDTTPVQDKTKSTISNYNFETNQAPYNLIDALSEPTPSTSSACTNLCPPEKPKRVKVPKEDQVLIAFSSTSTSSESVPIRKSEMVTKEVQCSLSEDVSNIQLEEPEVKLEACNLPAQTVLEVDTSYEGTIMTVEGSMFWIVTEDLEEVRQFMLKMTEYYNKHKVTLTTEQVKSLTYCAYFDEESVCYYRALNLKMIDDDPTRTLLFVVDTGEMRVTDAGTIQPLAPQFASRPPYGRACCLAGIDMKNREEELKAKREELIKEYVGTMCCIEVDDNTSELLGVYIRLPSGETINNIMVHKGLATLIEKPISTSVDPQPESEVQEAETETLHVPPEYADDDCPEYDDPVEAVTGYHNRDEADICKHYKGGPEKTCFKGSRCTKKHIKIHPEGWTLDKVNVVAKVKPARLPAPGSWTKVLVTSVCHFDRVYVQIVDDQPAEDPVPEFGVVLPPTSLAALCRDMNSPATRYTYKPLTMTPAPGELVAALYPVDKLWYRAKVLTVTRCDQSVEIQYIDYGTVLWVKEDNIRQLCGRFTALPTQAVQCALAGVYSASLDSRLWARAKRALSDMLLDRTVDCHVVGRDYDEIAVELYDHAGYSVAEQMAAQNLIQLREYAVYDDTDVNQKHVVP